MFEIRRVEDADHPFIYDSWLKNYAKSPLCSMIESQDFYPAHRRVVTSILERDTTFGFIAHPTGEPGVILGYVIGEPRILHFCFVKQAFRNMGIGRALFREARFDSGVFTFTHWTFMTPSILFKFKGHQAKFNPYLLGEEHE